MTFDDILDVLSRWEGQPVLVTVERREVLPGLPIVTLRGTLGAIVMDDVDGRGAAFMPVGEAGSALELNSPGVVLEAGEVTGGAHGSVNFSDDEGRTWSAPNLQVWLGDAMTIVFTAGPDGLEVA